MNTVTITLTLHVDDEHLDYVHARYRELKRRLGQTGQLVEADYQVTEKDEREK